MTLSYTLQELAAITKTSFVGDPSHKITGVDELETATPLDVSFLSNPKYKKLLQNSAAGIICISQNETLLEGKNYLLSENPSATFQQIVSLLFFDKGASGFTGIHPTAVIHPTVSLGKDVSIGPYVVIDQHSKIGDGTKIEAHVSIGQKVEIGKNCHLYPHAVVRESISMGDRVIIQPGAIIGGCGFGYITNERGKHIKVHHFGRVILEDDVEIGANTTVDRGRFKETRIAKGSKVDNLVMIAHNVSIGEDNLIVAQTGISGSSKTGKRVILGGQAGIVGHIKLADDTIVLARGAPSKSLEKGIYGGAPARRRDEYLETEVHLRNLGSYVKRIKKLEENLSTER